MGRPKKEEVVAAVAAQSPAEVAGNVIITDVAVPAREDYYREKFRKILQELTKELPSDVVKTRKQGGAELSYIEWFTAADYLDRLAIDWSSKVESVHVAGGNVIVVVSITIDGVTRSNVGLEPLDTSSYGDPASNSFAMAFKRAAALFGLARHLYHKDAPEGQETPGKATPVPKEVRADGKLEALITGTKVGEGAKGPYKYLEVKVEGQKFPLKSFYHKQEDVDDLMADLNAGSSFPVKCFVTLIKSGNFMNIDKFYPDLPLAPSDSAPSSTDPYGDTVPF